MQSLQLVLKTCLAALIMQSRQCHYFVAKLKGEVITPLIQGICVPKPIVSAVQTAQSSVYVPDSACTFRAKDFIEVITLAFFCLSLDADPAAYKPIVKMQLVHTDRCVSGITVIWQPNPLVVPDRVVPCVFCSYYLQLHCIRHYRYITQEQSHLL